MQRRIADRWVRCASRGYHFFDFVTMPGTSMTNAGTIRSIGASTGCGTSLVGHWGAYVAWNRRAIMLGLI
jgi:hypothetical protein